MPIMDGFEVIEQTKKDRDFSDTTVMMLTSDNRSSDIERCKRLGITGYVVKPIKRSCLKDAIIAAMSQKQDVPERPPFSKRDKCNIAAVRTAEQEEGTESLHILLVEDNPVNQKLAVRMLEKRGHRIFVANNGREALDAVVKECFDIILMDVHMPEMDGIEATASIRAMEKENGSHTPIIAMTALAVPGDKERCLDSGMDGYISKPIKSKELYNAINNLVAISVQNNTDTNGAI